MKLVSRYSFDIHLFSPRITFGLVETHLFAPRMTFGLVEPLILHPLFNQLPEGPREVSDVPQACPGPNFQSFWDSFFESISVYNLSEMQFQTADLSDQICAKTVSIAFAIFG